MNNIRYYDEGRVALIAVPLSLLERLPDVDSEDVGALSNMPRQIAGVEVGICIKEKKSGVYKVSMRTSELVNAADVCALKSVGNLNTEETKAEIGQLPKC